ncbi:MAG: cupin domain-containing protein [Candidatus Omnitrophica bacterium]|nr:cupin domain-containing protein [Candidatus Omnitrophota bacterium]
MPNIFEDIPEYIKEELFEELAGKDGIRIERIVSEGQCTPPGVWLSQERNEWVLLLAGEAELSFRNAGGKLYMRPGEHVLISSGTEHRVEWTSTEEQTVWLAVHF